MNIKGPWVRKIPLSETARFTTNKFPWKQELEYGFQYIHYILTGIRNSLFDKNT